MNKTEDEDENDDEDDSLPLPGCIHTRTEAAGGFPLAVAEVLCDNPLATYEKQG